MYFDIIAVWARFSRATTSYCASLKVMTGKFCIHDEQYFSVKFSTFMEA